MKRLFLSAVMLCVLMLVIPVVVVPLVSMGETEEVIPVMEPKSGGGDRVTEGRFQDPYKITIYRTATQKTEEVDFEEYVAGMVASELTPQFPLEAIKAQAVATRSFMLSKIAEYMEKDSVEGHHGATLCDDFMHCRSYTSIEEETDKEYIAQVRKAVEETRGEYLTYDNRVAKTYFHKISGGKTENVQDIWGVEIPYLMSVDSSWDATADGFQSRVFYPKDAFLTVIRGLRPELTLPDALENQTLSSEHSDAGAVKSITIFGEKFSGQEMVEAFGLRSRNFSLEYRDGQAVFDVRGNGHGVGMSQAGARGMAEEGKEYQEILLHYYPGVSKMSLYQMP